ncbi:ATP-binding cassette domain-containing protein [Actinophytocola algeriensis]|jgi:ABC-2 type transport system ATP-binding protein|uniref:ABC-2 type transport system ATP-binding protein n=1 Tax=Actinophytocola algeriensis TaxID=1768010 RepID=A0A7W7PZF0_9PSEU|nr:ABC transporter ATP-binding protein [Actinophytocola algeriensis]MBB4904160.1 ABC-2 type transport system ATP-binding protein [Actinophytocola algeriensis]MBE1476983.1 ABC-2 type transport system ATP-binding protein [Actinophytocola algeriensis]
MTDIEVTGLGKRFDTVDALTDVSFSLSGNKICGLLGRNGAGKTTLLSIVAGFERQTGGTVLVDGEPVWENPVATGKVCLVRGVGDATAASVSVRELLDYAARLRPGWDARYAGELLEKFEVAPEKQAKSLSHGKRCALGVTIGLASRAPVTIFDESYLGLDAPSRYAFYDALLADVLAHPRLVIISTHLIEEVATLFEDVLILDRGKLMLHEDADTMRAAGAAVTGDAALVDSFTLGLEVLGERMLGRTKSAMVYGPLDEKRRARAREAGLDLDPIALQDLFVHLTSGGAR